MESIDPTYRNYLLNEDKRTDQAKARCLQVIRNHFNNASWLDITFNHQDNPQGLSYIDYMFKQFMEEFYHDVNYRKRGVMRLAPLFCKLAFEANFQNNNPDTDKIHRLTSILFLIYNMDAQGKNISSKIDIDNTSFDDLNNQFGTIIDDIDKQEDERIENTIYELNPDYEVIGPIDYETAHEYGEKSCSTSKLCYTQSKSIWDNYSNNGYNNAYIILKKGWENIPEKHDNIEYNAYDTYGLSMIFVFVNGQGNITTCNTRWNHEAKYAPGFKIDYAMNRTQISELIGAKFNDVFKPNNKIAKLTADIQRRLDNGESPRYVFDKMWNFKEGLATVFIRGEGFNFITTENKILCPNMWFDFVYNFENGLALVFIRSEGYNWIKTDGKYLRPDIRFDFAFDFKDGIALVEIRNKKYKIDTNGILYDLNGNRVDIPVQESKKYNNSKSNIIRLTESDLHRVIKESVKKVLNEGFGSKVVKNPKLTRLLNREGLGDILLCKGYGYFYITSDNEELANKISMLYSNSIYLNSFNQQSPEEWVEDIKYILRDIE